MTTTWVLGAPDPEMAAIERLLRDRGRAVAYATTGGARVHPGSAYQADGTEPAVAPGSDLVLVECALPGLVEGARTIDHHRPGDPGYGLPPRAYLQASSLGQVLMRLYGAEEIWLVGDRPTLCVPCERCAELTRSPYDYVRVPTSLLIIAAADHCLAAAYRGECPGAAPSMVRSFRLRSRAQHQGRSVEALQADVEQASRLLRAAPRLTLGGAPVADMRPGRGAPCGEHGPTCDGSQATCWGDVPELPEAAAYLGLPFLAIPRPGPGGRKLVLQAASPEAVEAFLTQPERFQIRQTYGDPARGFAGGIIN